MATLHAVLTLTLLAGPAADGPRVESHGFGFKTIDAGWTSKPVEAGADGAVTLVLDHTAGGVRASVRAELLPTGKTVSIMVADRLAYARASKEFQAIGAAARSMGESRVEGVKVNQRDASGVEYRVRQFFVIEHGLLYTLQEIAPAATAEKKDELFTAVWSALEFVEPASGVKEDAMLRSLAARCGGEIEWAVDWADAAKRSHAEKKTVLVLVRLYPGLPDKEVGAGGPWMDHDVVDLVRERFVPLRLESGMEAPFRAPEVYGMGPSAFGNSALIVDAQGRVITDTFVGDAFALQDFLRANLGPLAPGGGNGMDEAERCLRGGDWDRAEKLLAGGPDSPRRHQLRADLLRRRRDGEGAIAELERARDGANDAQRAAIDVDAAVVFLRLGRTNAAELLLDQVLASKPEPALEARALYWRGAAAAPHGQHDVAITHWDRLVRDHPEDRWTWLAAADRIGLLFSLGAGTSQRWPPEDVLTAIKTPPRAKLDRAKIRQAEHDALEFLITTQRGNGSWVNPSELETATIDSPDAFVDAGAAICGLALLPHRKDARAAAALEKALGFVLSQQPRWPLDQSASFFMDYTAWRHAYVLRFLAGCIAREVGDAQQLRTEMAGLVTRLGKLQQVGGGWTYFFTSELSPSDAKQPAVGPSISFVTAAVVAALQDAKEQRCEIPDAMLERALVCLDAMEGTNGAYRYWVMPGGNAPIADEGLRGAAGRGPLCAHALERAGRRDRSDVKAALDIFLEHGPELAREQGKSLMHCGAEGQGSHYLFFDYANTALAVRSLPAGERGKYAELVMDCVLAGRHADGSFVDNPLIGRTVGTGFALIAMEALGGGESGK